MSIKVLSNKEKARTRINVFHDSSSNWINLIKELIGNSLDIFPKEETHHISIDIINSNKIEYCDDGCGVPLEGVASNGMPNYQAIFEVDFAGSRYGNKGQTVGQNGVFFWTLAMSSEDFEIEVGRPDGKVYYIAYHKGDRLGDLKVIGKTDKTYTKVTFSPDKEVWTNPNYTFGEISKICEAQASMGNVEIRLKSGNKEGVYRYEQGIQSYFRLGTANKHLLSNDICIKKQVNQLVEKMGKEFEIDVDIILAFSNDNEEDFKKEFLNTADLIKFGTINKGIIAGIRNSANRWLRENNKYIKNEKQIKEEDVEVGLNYIADIRSNYVEYVSQSKQSTDAIHYKTALQKILEDYLAVYAIENPIEIEKIYNQILINKRSREKANQTRLNVQKKLSESVTILNKIPNLIDCKSKDTTQNVLCICEGKSSLGSILSGRRDIHAILPLRGKILNCLKASNDKIFSNEIILNLVQALGCGVTIKTKNKEIMSFDEAKLRYSKVFIIVDQDLDGIGSILPLVLTVFYRLMPELINQGRIYVCETPKYEIVCKDGTELYAINDEELEEVTKSINQKYDLHYIKGLAELSEKSIAMCLSEGYKNLKQLRMGDVEKSIQELELWMGDKVEPRKEYIMNNFNPESEGWL